MLIGRKQIMRSAWRLAGGVCLWFTSAGLLQAQLSAPPSSGYVAPNDPGASAGGGGGGANVFFDQPTAYEPMPPPPEQATEPSDFAKTIQAVCWYLPNRVMDLADIPRVHLALGDGQGASLRLTKFLCASWFEDEAYCLGWTKRRPPWFGEQIQERYFGFLAATEGKMARDPSEVGLSFHLLIIGLNGALSLGEMLDAMTGLAGIDLMGDDHGPVMIDKTQPDTAAQAQTHRMQQAVYSPQQQPLPATPAPSGQSTPPAKAPADGARDNPPLTQPQVIKEPVLPQTHN